MKAVTEHTPSTVRVNNRRLLLDRFLASDAVTVSAGLGAATVHVDVDADGFWYNLRENAAAS